MIAYQNGVKPCVNWSHIDGPMLSCGNGSVRWLTRKERIMLRLRLTTVEKLSAALDKVK